MGKVSFLHTNDMHGTLSDDNFSRLEELRQECDLYFDSGDCISAGNLAIPLRTDPVWSKFSELRLDGSVLGNRETHPLESAMNRKREGANHPILVGNLTRPDGSLVFESTRIIEVCGIKIGLFGVMVPMATEQKPDKALWAYRWQQPIPVACRLAEELRPSVDLLIGLTHIGHGRDLELAKACPQIDIIFGGHSHTVLPEPVRVGNTFICQGGAHNKFAGVYQWSGGVLSGGLRSLRA